MENTQLSFTANVAAFKSGFSKVNKVIPDKVVQEALSNVKLEVSDFGIKMTGSSGHVTSITYLGEGDEMLALDIQTQGGILINAKLFEKVLAVLPEESFALHVKDNKAILTSGTSEFELPILDTETYPLFNKRGEQIAFHVEAKILKEMFRRTKDLSGSNLDNPILGGVHLFTQKDQLIAEATNQRIGGAYSHSVNDLLDFSIVLPRKYFFEAFDSTFGSNDELVNVEISDNIAVFSDENNQIITRLVEGNFPDLQRLIQSFGQGETSVIVDTATIKAVLSHAEIFANLGHENQSAILSISENGIAVSLNTKEMGGMNEVVPVGSFSGDAIKIAFNPTLLGRQIKFFNEERLSLNFNGALKPVRIFSPENDKYVQVSTPVRVNRYETAQ